MKNKEVAKLLYEIAELLSLAGENPFKIRAYERGSQTIDSLTGDIEELAREGKLQEIPGIGEGMSEKITEYLKTGHLKYIDELKKNFPEGLLEIMAIPGIGPKKAKIMYDKLKISSVSELRKAAKEGRLRDLPGFAEKTEQNILGGIELKEKAKGRILLSDALRTADDIVSYLKKYKEVINIEPAGSLRRRKETIGDIDILCTVEKGREKFIIDKFTSIPGIQKVVAAGSTKASIISEDGMQVDLRVIESASYGAALQYFTGSKEHNIALRELANKKGYTINEYGVFKLSQKNKSVAGKTEGEIYKLLGLEYIEPELRENHGEIEAAKSGKLPELLRLEDIKGETHIHSKFSDGADSIFDITEKAAECGYEWTIITDHSQGLKVAGGLSVVDLRRKMDEIRKVNLSQKKIKILTGAEVDILSDGKLDYPDEVLKEIDFVAVSIHSGFKQSQEKIHQRIFSAFQNKYVHTLSHPTGRLIGAREPYSVNIEKVIEEAKKTGVFLEINAYPERLDLYDYHCKKAKETGVKITIGTDAHHVDQLNYMVQGVYVARRGWLEKNDVINTLSYEKLVKSLKTRR